nr:hypothetical protein [Chloroflexota bacterium]
MKTLDKISHGDDRIEMYATLAEAREQFGENYDGLVFKLTCAQVEGLLQGKVVAFDIRGREYAGFLVVDEAAHA